MNTRINIMRPQVICLLFLLLPGVLVAAEPKKDAAPPEPSITLPTELKARPGRLLLIQAKTEGKVIRWVSLSEDADVLPYLNQGAIFSAPTAGRYRILAYTASGDVPSLPAITTVVVADPSPPGPSPGPNPNPPDPFTQALRAAYAAEADTAKMQQVTLLIALYRNAATSTVNQTDLKTLGDLYQVLRTAGATLLPKTALPRIRRAIADELDQALGTNVALSLDDASRKKAATELDRVAKSLESLK
jgi:hypothetical protein